MTTRGGEGSAAPPGVRRSARSGDPHALPRRFYRGEAESVARALLGARVVSVIGGALCSAAIVETEAYVGPDDEASHGHRRFGRTSRNSAMFGEPGIAYVYRIYGVHWCVNAVTGEEGHPAAVLLRAARPLDGVEVMRARRPGRADRDLLRGPGNLCRALGVTGDQNGHPLDGVPLWIEGGDPVPDGEVVRGPRVGISRAVDLPLRFWVKGSPFVSR